MSRIVVVGATGRTGRMLVEMIASRGDTPVAIFRNPLELEAIEKLGECVLLDLLDAPVEELAGAMKQADAVIFAAGTREDEDNVDEIDRDGAIKTAEAARQAGVKRFVQISAMGVRTGLPDGIDDKMKAYYTAKKVGDEHLAGTDLDWTILEPGELTDERGTGLVEVAPALGRFASVSRQDVAATALAALSEPASIGKAFEMAAGDLSPSEALQAAARHQQA